jgi:plastocyanin domain-containing protein
MDWIINNMEWVFSGIGVAIISLIGWLVKNKSNKSTKMKQKSGNNSTNIQIKGDYNNGK